jgi:hypothetical protein
MTRYDRRPRREWDEPERGRSAVQQIGTFRLVGFIAIVAGSFIVLNRPKDETPTTNVPRIAVDGALATIVRAQLPKAKLTAGESGNLAAQIRGGLTVDAAILTTAATQLLTDQERCSNPEAVATRATSTYAGCLVNANGSSRALGAAAIDALTDLEGRDALLEAGFEVPPDRPTPVGTTP